MFQVIYNVTIILIAILVLAKEYAVKEPVRSWVRLIYHKGDVFLLSLKKGILLQYVLVHARKIRKAVFYALFYVVTGCLSYLIWDIQYAMMWSLLGVISVASFWAVDGLDSVNKKEGVFREIKMAPGVSEGFMLISIGLLLGRAGVFTIPLKPHLAVWVHSEYFPELYLIVCVGWLVFAWFWFKALPVLVKILFGLPLYFLKTFFSVIFNYVNEKLTTMTLLLVDLILQAVKDFIF